MEVTRLSEQGRGPAGPRLPLQTFAFACSPQRNISGHVVGYQLVPQFIGVRGVVSLTVEHTWDGRAVDMIEAGRDKRRRWRGNFDCCHVQLRGSSIKDIRPEHIIPTQNPLMALPEAAGSPGGR